MQQRSTSVEKYCRMFTGLLSEGLFIFLCYSIRVLRSNGWMEASLYLRCPLTSCPLSTLRLVFVFSFFYFLFLLSHLNLCCDFIKTQLQGINFCILTLFVSPVGSTFAQFLSSLSERCVNVLGVRRRTGQIPEGKTI